jgi:alpha-galactosidase
MPILSTPSGWLLQTKSTAYTFEVSQQGYLIHTYWGPSLAYTEDYPSAEIPERWGPDGTAHLISEEYPVFGGLKYNEPCLKATFADGVRDLVLQFVEAKIIETENPQLTLHCKDAYYPLNIDLIYILHEKHDLIERKVRLTNTGQENISIERAFSAQWHLPAGQDYYLTHLYGRWLDEFNIQRERLTPGTKVLESRRITSSHHHSPWFAVDSEANEDQGSVWFSVLAWSGNWKLTAEITERHNLELSFGLNDWDFAWLLRPGESFETPSCIAGYTNQGFGDARRRLHRYINETVLPHGSQQHQILYNSWEATFFDVDEKSQIELAKIAAEIGIELFVMDDGWFHGRKDDTAGLGDWWPDEKKFPKGLTGLISEVNRLGMDFGLWIEPEMVNPESDLYRKHSDWVIHFPTRQRSEARNQLILNMGKKEVQDYVLQVVSKLLQENKIRFIKWDMNRNVSEPGWQDAPGDARELYVRYTQGLYDVWGELRRRFPDVTWQSCSSGGGRADVGILRFADQIWVSDNTEATARLRIQEGFSHVFPASTMEAWVTDSAKELVSLEFRFHVSMFGSLGVGAHLLHWNQQEKETAKQCIRLYKKIRPIVQQGDQYWLRFPQTSPFSAVIYVDKQRQEGVLFAFRVQIPDPVKLPPLFLRGLDENGLYKIEGEAQVRSGKSLMSKGLQLNLKNMQSCVKMIQRVK